MTYKLQQRIVAGIGIGSAILLGLFSVWNQKPVTQLLRPQSGEAVEQLQVQFGEEQCTMDLIVTAPKLSEEEIEEKLSEAEKQLERLMLGDNEDAAHIVTDLYLPMTFPGTEILLEWNISSWRHINPDGSLNTLGMQEPEEVRIQAVLTLQGREKLWARSMVLYPSEAGTPEEKAEIVQQMLQEKLEQSSDHMLILPDRFQGESIQFFTPKDNRWILMALLTIGTVLVLELAHEREEKRKGQEKRRRMEMDYAEIVSRLSLYMGAGISTRNAWERIVKEYEQTGVGKSKPREAYEEMIVTLHEMQSGVSEVRAYECFGKRCKIPMYLKLGTLLGQNLRKGTKDLACLLEEEAREAFENRKALARKMGEECETKLLMPMMLMLLVILIMILYPAVISFQV